MILNSNEEEECCFKTKNALINGEIIILSDFNDLKELKFKCKESINISILYFKPNKPIIFDDSLDMNSLTINSNIVLSIGLLNFKGFNLGSNNPFRNLKSNKPNQHILQIASPFDLYYNKKLIDKTNCNKQIPSLKLAQQINTLDIIMANKNSGETCPFIFKNIKFLLLSINNLRNSLIYRNKFTFFNVSISNNDLNCSIYETYLIMYHSELNTKLLNENVFKKLFSLDINGIINKIDKDTFKNLDNLQLLRIKSQNIKQIFVKNNKWLKYLNYKKYLNNIKNEGFVLSIYQSIENVTYYSYPNEDFCLFKDFPHERFVIPILRPNTKSECTCTELFLIQYLFSIDNSVADFIRNFRAYYVLEYYAQFQKLYDLPDCALEEPIHKIRNCNFIQRLAKCNIETVKNVEENTNLDIYIYDLIEFSDIILFLFKKYLNLIFVILTLIINILMVIILSSKSLKKDRMYTYLNINSIFNSFSCLITIIDYIVSYYTIDIDSKTISYQYYNLILIKLIGNSIKTCSNISHLSFGLSRYKKIKGKDYIFIKSLNNLSFKLYLFLIIIFSIGINLYVYFQHEIISLESNDKASVQFLDNPVLAPFNDYKVNFSDTEFIILNVFQCLKILFSDLSYIIATTIIDIFLFKIVKKQMENKRKLVNQNNNNNNKKKENKISAEYRMF